MSGTIQHVGVEIQESELGKLGQCGGEGANESPTVAPTSTEGAAEQVGLKPQLLNLGQRQDGAAEIAAIEIQHLLLGGLRELKQEDAAD